MMMMRKLKFRAAGLGLSLALAAGGATAQSPQENGAAFAPALAAANAGRWEEAVSLAAANPDDIAVEIIDWIRLRAGEGSFAEYEHFLTENADWPGLPLMSKVSESEIPEGLAPARLETYFAAIAPQTATGIMRLADARRRDGRTEDGAVLIAEAWRSMELSSDDEAAMRSAWPQTTSAQDAARLDWLLWKRDRAAAERYLERVDAPARQLAEVRIALQADASGVDALIAALSPAQLADGGLARDRFDWRMRNGYEASALELLDSVSMSAASLGRPAFWAGTRRSLARQLLREGNAEQAYRVAAQHQLSSGNDDFDDLEWLAGYIALTRLDQPRDAVRHFTRFQGAVSSPISQGRAGYWLGVAERTVGNEVAAAAAFANAARYQTSFYGQLAAVEGAVAADAALTGSATPIEWYDAGFLTNDSVRAAILLYFAGDVLQSHRFMAHESESLSPDDAAKLAQLAMEMGMPQAALNIAKNHARNGDVIMSAYYPLAYWDVADLPVPVELALAIIRQESEFYTRAISSVGARGLMQVMPDTAREVAGRLELDYDADRLLSDQGYNIQIGSAYLAELLERYTGSYLLAAAAYNAGPTRVDRWIIDYGDPRIGADPIIWAESIPFSETRNYVQRVMEAVFVFRARLTGEVGAQSLPADLQRGRS